MIFNLRRRPSTWEAVALLQLAQGRGMQPAGFGTTWAGGDEETLLELGGLRNLSLKGRSAGPTLTCMVDAELDAAYRLVEDGTKPYVQVLAEQMGIPYSSAAPVVPVTPSRESAIVVCPFAVHASCRIDPQMWPYILQHLRSYGQTVYLAGDTGQRIPHGTFLEEEILGNYPIKDRLETIAGASLVVGVPGTYLWLAAGYKRPLIVLYPDSVPRLRWFPYDTPGQIRIEFPVQVQLPVLLAGLRSAIEREEIAA